MVVQNFRSKNSSESDTFLNIATETELNKTMINKNTVMCEKMWKSVTGILILSLVTLNVTFLFIAINKTVTINQLHDQVNILQQDVDMLKYRFFDDSLLKEMAEFEMSYADDPQSQPDSEDQESVPDGTNYLDDFDYSKVDSQDFSDYDVEPKTKSKSKRDVMAATLDGVPIITESYAEQKRRNASAFKALTGSTGEGLRLYESLGKNTPAPPTHQYQKHHTQRTFHTGGWTTRTYMHHGRGQGGVRPTPLVSRTSRVMDTDEDKSRAFRKIVKKSMLKSGPVPTATTKLYEHVESVQVTLPPASANRRGSGHGHRHGNKGRRNSHLMEGAEVVGGHFYGNTSHLVAGKHHGYRGNGHLAHPQGLYVDWEASAWMKAVGADRVLQLQQGEVVVREAGLYLVYAQIYYVDEHDLNGFQIVRNGAELAQCTTMTHTERKLDKRNTCWTATLAALADGDRISVRDIETHRYAYLAHAKSFFGMYKLADLNTSTNTNTNSRHSIK